MKKILLTLLVLFVATLHINATDYTGSLAVYGVSDDAVTADDATVSVTKNTDGTYKVLIPNVIVSDYNVGDVVIDNMTATYNDDGSITLVSEPKGNLNNVVANNCNTATKLLLGGKDSKGNYGIQTTIKGTIKDGKAVFDVGPYEKKAFGKTYNLSLHYEGSDGTQGIAAVTADNAQSDHKVYNIAGQQVNAVTKGVVIKNGRKYLSR